MSAGFLLGCFQFPLWSRDVLDMKEMPYLSISIQLAFPLSPFALVLLEFLLHCCWKKTSKETTTIIVLFTYKKRQMMSVRINSKGSLLRSSEICDHFNSRIVFVFKLKTKDPAQKKKEIQYKTVLEQFIWTALVVQLNYFVWWQILRKLEVNTI